MSPQTVNQFSGTSMHNTPLNVSMKAMSVLAAGGLDWATIKAECLSQESGRNWASHLVGKLEELEEKYDIVAPVTVELREWAEVHAMGAAVSALLGRP